MTLGSAGLSLRRRLISACDSRRTALLTQTSRRSPSRSFQVKRRSPDNLYPLQQNDQLCQFRPPPCAGTRFTEFSPQSNVAEVITDIQQHKLPGNMEFRKVSCSTASSFGLALSKKCYCTLALGSHDLLARRLFWLKRSFLQPDFTFFYMTNGSALCVLLFARGSLQVGCPCLTPIAKYSDRYSLLFFGKAHNFTAAFKR